MPFAVRFALLCALLVSAAGAAPAVRAQPLSALLGHMRSVNPDLLHAHIINTSTHVLDGAPSVVTTNAQDLRYLQQRCNGSVCVGTYFDGERVYDVNLNGTTLPRADGSEPYVRALRVLAMLSFLDPAFDGKIYDRGMASYAGKRLRLLFVEDRIALPLKVYIDPRTALVRAAQTFNGQTIAFSDYRRVGRFMLPYSVDLNGAPLERYTNRIVDSQPFAQPHPPRVVATSLHPHVNLDPQSVSPLATCQLAGTAAACLIDSGNSGMAMSLELAEDLHLQPVGMLPIAGLGNYATEVVHAGPLDIGGIRLDSANYVVLTDIHHLGYDIVVGADVLAAVPVTLEAARHVISFERAAKTDSGVSVPIAFQNFIPVVDVTLGMQPSVLAVDTGDQSNINLAYEYYAEHSGLFTVTHSRSVTGVGGQSEELLGEIDSVRIGSITAQNQQIGATRTLRGTADGHLGAAFLSKFRVVLDYARQVMRLQPVD